MASSFPLSIKKIRFLKVLSVSIPAYVIILLCTQSLCVQAEKNTPDGNEIVLQRNSSRLTENQDESSLRENYQPLDSHISGLKEDVHHDSRLREKGDTTQMSNSGDTEWFFKNRQLNITTVPVIDKRPIPLSRTDQKEDEEQELTIKISSGNHHIFLDLQATRNLLAATYKEPNSRMGRGQVGEANCEWQGVVRGLQEKSMVALSICPVIRGIIVSGDSELLVEPAFGSTTLNQSHLIYSNTMVTPTHSSCGVSSNQSRAAKLNLNDSATHRNLKSRRAIRNGANGPLWTDKRTRFVELVLVVDRSFYMDFRDEVYDRCRGIVNIVNAVYRDLGIVVVLTDIEVWSQGNQITVSSDHVTTLGNLGPYRETLLKNRKNINNDNTVLLTTVDFIGSTVGYATVSGMCSNQDSVAIVQDKKDAIGIVAQTMAHEMGHNLGMTHDDDVVGCICPSGKCIMASEGSSIYRSDIGWSTCSKKALANEIDSVTFDCLRNIPESVYRTHGKTCGNGVVDGDEECDCGPSDYCNNRCCVAETCKLAVNASCASGACCNMESCQTHEVGKVCREAVDECDLPEYCSGHSEYCPTDVYKWNGISCDKGEGHCLNGMCGSPEDRCIKLWGPGTKATKSACHSMNEVGNENGNCGWRDTAHTVLKACPKDSRACGTLHCQPVLDGKPVLRGAYTYGRSGNCHHIYGSNKIPDSFWLTPNGTPCGDGKICIDQECEAIKYPDGVTECPKNCSNKGVCNNRGNCHCNAGYAPPDCYEAGHGGSFDSGSVNDSRYKRPILEGILLFLAILIPFIALICCCWRKIRRWWEKKGNSRMSNSCPILAACMNVCCCPAMTKITEWMVTVVPVNKKKMANKHEIEQVVDDEEAQTFCQVDVDFKGEAQTNSWGVADERLFTEIVTITPKSSPDLKRKIRLPSNSPILHHKSTEALDRAKTYQQSISVDSGCVSDHDEVNTHRPVSSQMSMTSLIGVFCKFGKGSVKNTSHNEVNRRSRAFGSQKSIPLSRFVVDPLAGNRNPTRHKTPPPPENIRPSFSRSVSSDATSSLRIHPKGPPKPPPSAMKPHKSDENLHKISKTPGKRISLFSKTAVSEENLESTNQETANSTEKKPMIPPQKNKDNAKKTSPVRTAPAPPKKKPKESKPEAQNPLPSLPKQELNTANKNITDNSKKKPKMPPKAGQFASASESPNSFTKSKPVPPPIPTGKGNSVKAMAMKLEPNQQ